MSTIGKLPGGGKLYILDVDGDPVVCPDVMMWARWFETANRQLAEDFIGGVRVSTVFLGLDHNHRGGTPVLWETLVFSAEPGHEAEGFEDCGNRYRSRAEALAGHASVVAEVKRRFA